MRQQNSKTTIQSKKLKVNYKQTEKSGGKNKWTI